MSLKNCAVHPYTFQGKIEHICGNYISCRLSLTYFMRRDKNMKTNLQVYNHIEIKY